VIVFLAKDLQGQAKVRLLALPKPFFCLVPFLSCLPFPTLLWAYLLQLEAYSQIATTSCPSSLAIVQPLLETETNLSKQEQLKQMCQVLRVYQVRM
jgi:hypothetical protein